MSPYKNRREIDQELEARMVEMGHYENAQVEASKRRRRLSLGTRLIKSALVDCHGWAICPALFVKWLFRLLNLREV